MTDVMDAYGTWRVQTELALWPIEDTLFMCARAPKRRVAVLIAHGVKAEPVAMASAALTRAGATPRLIGTGHEPVRSVDGQEFVPDSTLEASADERFAGLVLPDGDEAVSRLLRDSRAVEVINAQCRNGSPIFVGTASVRMLDAAGITSSARAPDRGFIIGKMARLPEEIDEFVAAVIAAQQPGENLDAQ